MRIRGIADAVKLKVRVSEPGFRSLRSKIGILGELDTVGCGLHAVVAELTGITNGIQKVRGESRLAPGELHRHLTPGLDAECVVKQRLDFVPGQFMYKSDLVGVHETRVTHHVAAV